MQTGYVISSAAHAALVGWVLFGGVFRSEPEDFEVTEVAVISSEAFAALTTAPRAETEIALPDPVQPTAEPDIEVPQDQAPSIEAPLATPVPEPETAPDLPLPEPGAEVEDEAPAPIAPPEDVAVAVPDVAERAVPKPAERVAPEPVETPPEDARPDVDVNTAERPQEDETPQDTPQDEPQEETAPEEAAPEIVTEAEEPAAAMTSSVRPPARRPTPPAQVAEPAPEPAPVPSELSDDAVAAALSEALQEPAARDVPQGPPLTAGEKDALRVAVQRCWNVGSLSSDALRTTVIVAVDMTEDGKPVSSSIRMLGFDGGNNASARQAFEAARRAILRCGARGFDLPSDKYGQWKEIEMTFNPERMRIR